jgi:hypothetical protein
LRKWARQRSFSYMKKLLALLFATFVSCTALVSPASAAQTVDLSTATPVATGVAPPAALVAAMLGNCSAPGVCGRIKNTDSGDRFRITYAWGGDGSTDRDLYPGQKSWDYGPDADGFRIGRCWRAHLWKYDASADPIISDYGYKYGPPASSSAGWTWFKVTDNIGWPADAYHWIVNGLVRVC